MTQPAINDEHSYLVSISNVRRTPGWFRPQKDMSFRTSPSEPVLLIKPNPWRFEGLIKMIVIQRKVGRYWKTTKCSYDTFWWYLLTRQQKFTLQASVLCHHPENTDTAIEIAWRTHGFVGRQVYMHITLKLCRVYDSQKIDMVKCAKCRFWKHWLIKWHKCQVSKYHRSQWEIV